MRRGEVKKSNIMNFRYGKKEVEYLKAKDRKLGAVIDRLGHVRFEVDGELPDLTDPASFTKRLLKDK